MSPGAGLRGELEGVFREALGAVDPADCVAREIESHGGTLVVAGEILDPGAKLVVLGVGKAAAAMASAVEARAGHWIRAGLVLTADGHGLPLSRCAVREASHPLPDARGERATAEVLELVGSAREADVLLVLLSGGTSSLLCGPAPGLERAALADTAAALLAGGASIDELNAVRKHLAAATGGRLALHARSRRILVLAISDVPGDRIDVIGSGPFAGDPSTYADALDVLARHDLRDEVPRAVREHLESGAAGRLDETPTPEDPRLAGVRTRLVASNRQALQAAERAARSRGWHTAVAADALRGEARRMGTRLAGVARAVGTGSRPLCLLAGGETVVHVRGAGRGGRSQELALAAALGLAGSGAALLAAGTDGIDGPTDAAGAFVDGGSVARGQRAGADAAAALADNDSYGFFSAEGGLIRTGPTRTNVMDLAFLFVPPSSLSPAG